jgi:hypothetical protein
VHVLVKLLQITSIVIRRDERKLNSREFFFLYEKKKREQEMCGVVPRMLTTFAWLFQPIRFNFMRLRSEAKQLLISFIMSVFPQVAARFLQDILREICYCGFL